MKEIYENMFDKNIAKRNGERIYTRGGMRALQNNYNSLMTVLGHLVQQRGSLDRDIIILVFYNIKTIVSEHWNGIGEWRH